MTSSLAGQSVRDRRLICAERNLTDEYDYDRCLNADAGNDSRT
jgi:hypothetical protein